MLDGISRKLRALRGDKGGNAALLVALGLPALIGGAGLAVDMSQWYMWKRELQFAVDQAALAGAWARSNADTQSTYTTRATQEYNANLQTVANFASAPNVSVVNYGVGTGNAVLVTAVANRRLPFSSLLTGSGVTLRVQAQASFAPGESYSGCLVAVDPHASGAFTLGGDASGDAPCGVVVLSDSESAAVQNGNSDAQLGSIIAAGDIDSDLADNAVLRAYTTGLSDPYASLPSPEPASSPARTYSCPTAQAATTTTTATVQTTTVVSYIYVRANNGNQAVSNAQNGTNSYSYSSPRAGSTTDNGTLTNQTVPTGTTNGSVDGVPSYADNGQVLSSPKVREVKKTITRKTYSSVVVTGSPGNDGIARPEPGRYTTINVACETHFQPGVFVVDDIDFGQNHVVRGTDVVFVVKNANGMHINSNSNINLSGITSTTLTTNYGMSDEDANALAGMLFYDKDSTEEIRVNGNSQVVLNGILYTPKRPLVFNGTGAVSGKCMMLIGSTITFTGTIDLQAFCLPSGASAPVAGGSGATIKLVV